MKLPLLIPAFLGASLLLAAPQLGFAQEDVLAQATKLRLQNKPIEAQKLMLDAKKSLEKLLANEKDNANKIALQNSLADVHFQLGEALIAGGTAEAQRREGPVTDTFIHFKDALGYYQQAYETDKITRKPQAAQDLLKISVAYSILEEIDKHISTLESAVTLYQQLKDQRGEANALRMLACAYRFRKKQPAEALSYLTRSLAIWEELKDLRQQEFLLTELADLSGGQGQYEQAIDYFERALQVAVAQKFRGGEAQNLYYIAKVYTDLKQPPKAVEYYERSWPIFEEVKNEKFAVDILFKLMLLYGADKPELAIARGETAIKLLKARMALAKAANDEQARALALALIQEFRANIVDFAVLMNRNGREADAMALLEWQQKP